MSAGLGDVIEARTMCFLEVSLKSSLRENFFLRRLTLENELFDNYGVAEQIRVAFPGGLTQKKAECL